MLHVLQKTNIFHCILSCFPVQNGPAEKKTIEPCTKHNRKCNDLMVIMGIALVLMEAIMVSTGM